MRNWKLEANPSNEPATGAAAAGPNGANLNSSASRGSEAEREVDLTLAVTEPVRTMDELIVADAVRGRIDVALSRIENHHLIYQDWGLASIDPHRRGTALNLYGPPGTGKSLAAEAIADRMGRPFVDVEYADIESRYVGQTPKNIIRCFEAATETKAVLVFNEADSILGSRLSDVRQSADHGVNVSRATMLRQLDLFDGLVVFTTNFPRNYDPAFVRRILDHVHFDLPDAETLGRLWARLLPEQLPLADDVERSQLVERSVGLAGGDLTNVVVLAAGLAATRTEAKQMVTMADLVEQLDSVRQAKEAVGKRNQASQVTAEHVPWSDLLTETKAKQETQGSKQEAHG